MTETTTVTLAAWLLERIAEDQYDAQGAERTSGRSEWLPAHFGAGGFDARVDDHIARHDPARALADCAAKRRIVELHRPYRYATDPVYLEGADLEEAEFMDETYPTARCKTCGSYWEYPVPWPCPTLLALAQPYAGEPGFRPEWRLPSTEGGAIMP